MRFKENDRLLPAAQVRERYVVSSNVALAMAEESYPRLSCADRDQHPQVLAPQRFD